jgi:hypothetical protein
MPRGNAPDPIFPTAIPGVVDMATVGPREARSHGPLLRM